MKKYLIILLVVTSTTSFSQVIKGKLGGKLNTSDTASMLSSYTRAQRMIDSLSLVQGKVTANSEAIEGNSNVVDLLDMAVSFYNDTLKVVSRYSNSNDLMIKFDRGLANNVFTIDRVDLILKSDYISGASLNKSSVLQLTDGRTTDMLGPYVLSTGSFVGSNHLSGGNKTADNIYHNIYVDGKLVPDSNVAYSAKEIRVEVKNAIYNYTLAGSGTYTTDFYEYQTYTIKEGQIQVKVRVEAVNNITFKTLYGLQYFKSNLLTFNQVFVPNSAIKGVTGYVDGGNYGTLGSYSTVDRIIISDEGLNNSVDMWLDKNYGLGTKYAMDTSKSVVLSSDNKLYHYLISKNTPLNTGDSLFYRGGYNFFKNSSQTSDSSFAYAQIENSTKYFYSQFAGILSKPTTVQDGRLTVPKSSVTPPAGTSSSQIATTSFVMNAILGGAPQSLTDSSVIIFNADKGINASVVLGATGRTLSISNPIAGTVYLLKIIQDATGSRTITSWPANTKWPGGFAPTLSTGANAVDVVAFYYDGSSFYANFNSDFK